MFGGICQDVTNVIVRMRIDSFDAVNLFPERPSEGIVAIPGNDFDLPIDRQFVVGIVCVTVGHPIRHSEALF